MKNALETVKINDLYYNESNPIKIRKGDNYYCILSSIQVNGQLEKISIRKKGRKKGCEVIDGRLRVEIFKDLGLDEIAVELLTKNDNSTIIHMLDSNMRRDDVLPSEYAALFKMRMEAMNKQGKRNDLVTSESNLQKLEKAKDTRDIIGEMVGKSGVTVSKYIRLTSLHNELLALVDCGKLGVACGADLSYLDIEAEQQWILRLHEKQKLLPSSIQAKQIKEAYQKKKLTLKALNCIMQIGTNNKPQKLVFDYSDFIPFFDEDTTPKEIKTEVLKVMTYWKNNRNK